MRDSPPSAPGRRGALKICFVEENDGTVTETPAVIEAATKERARAAVADCLKILSELG